MVEKRPSTANLPAKAELVRRTWRPRNALPFHLCGFSGISMTPQDDVRPSVTPILNGRATGPSFFYGSLRQTGGQICSKQLPYG